MGIESTAQDLGELTANPECSSLMAGPLDQTVPGTLGEAQGEAARNRAAPAADA